MKVNFVAVQFKHGGGRAGWTDKLYHYKTLIADLEVGDLVVVETQYGHSVARVARRLVKTSQANKYIVQKVDLTELEKHKARETQIEFLRADIRSRANAVREKQEMELLAVEDRELERLLKEMDELLS